MRAEEIVTRAGIVCAAGGSPSLVVELQDQQGSTVVLDVAAGSPAWGEAWAAAGIEPPCDLDLGTGGDLAGALLELIGARVGAAQLQPAAA